MLGNLDAANKTGSWYSLSGIKSLDRNQIFLVTLTVTTTPIPEFHGLVDAVKVPLSKMAASLFP